MKGNLGHPSDFVTGPLGVDEETSTPLFRKEFVVAGHAATSRVRASGLFATRGPLCRLVEEHLVDQTARGARGHAVRDHFQAPASTKIQAVLDHRWCLIGAASERLEFGPRFFFRHSFY